MMQKHSTTPEDSAQLRAQQQEHQAALQAQIEEKKRMQVIPPMPFTQCARLPASQLDSAPLRVP